MGIGRYLYSDDRWGTFGVRVWGLFASVEGIPEILGAIMFGR